MCSLLIFNIKPLGDNATNLSLTCLPCFDTGSYLRYKPQQTLGKKFSRRYFKIVFSLIIGFDIHENLLLKRQFVNCLLEGQFARNVKAFFTGKMKKKKNHYIAVCLICPESGKV